MRDRDLGRRKVLKPSVKKVPSLGKLVTWPGGNVNASVRRQAEKDRIRRVLFGMRESRDGSAPRRTAGRTDHLPWTESVVFEHE